MSYTVLWKPAAEQQLARLWTEATNRGAVTAAADQIDDLLARDPLNEGESRSPPTRILIVLPLAVNFSVQGQDRTVHVQAVWRWGRT